MQQAAPNRSRRRLLMADHGELLRASRYRVQPSHRISGSNASAGSAHTRPARLSSGTRAGLAISSNSSGLVPMRSGLAGLTNCLFAIELTYEVDSPAGRDGRRCRRPVTSSWPCEPPISGVRRHDRSARAQPDAACPRLEKGEKATRRPHRSSLQLGAASYRRRGRLERAVGGLRHRAALSIRQREIAPSLPAAESIAAARPRDRSAGVEGGGATATASLIPDEPPGGSAARWACHWRNNTALHAALIYPGRRSLLTGLLMHQREADVTSAPRARAQSHAPTG